MTRKQYLESELATQIERLDRESTRHKRLYRGLRYLVFALTACSAVLAGAALAVPQHLEVINVAIVVTSAVVGFVTSVEGLRKPSELWIHERTTMYALKDLERALQYAASESQRPLGAQEIDGYFARFQALLGAAGTRWSREILNNDKSQSETPEDRAQEEEVPDEG
ncbi:MAG: DUF4231 domain-containing protein [Acidobacteria bacterium]|nr:MAG: DUF4231 domain-containing protein [Acidobacteriota bacterium]REK08547.1 MAG: DUF4231 domain-containing protein [Acidobacteriota bacterium]